MLDRLAEAWKLGREWGRRNGPEAGELTALVQLHWADLPVWSEHIRAFRDGAKDGATGIKEMSRAPRRWNGRLD